MPFCDVFLPRALLSGSYKEACILFYQLPLILLLLCIGNAFRAKTLGGVIWFLYVKVPVRLRCFNPCYVKQAYALNQTKENPNENS